MATKRRPMMSLRSIGFPLPEDHVQYDKAREDDEGHLHRVAVGLDFGVRVDEALEFGDGFGFGYEADENRNDEAGAPGPDGCPEVLGHLAGIGRDEAEPASFDASDAADRER